MIYDVLLGIFLVVVGIFMLVLLIIYGNLWFQAYMSNASISIWNLVGMSLRQVNAQTIVKAKIIAMQSGIANDPQAQITTRRLEAHYLAGGDIPRVITALVAAHRAGIDLDFDRACAIDLAGRDVLEAVQTSVNPKVISCPDPNISRRNMLSAVAKNGIELNVKAKVTVRTNLTQLIGGATEETIIARVGEGIITAIGSADTHSVVMENPDMISRTVLSRGLDAQTAFEIVAINIEEIQLGNNIGARLQADQAEANTRVARAEAAGRRALAVSMEQEMKAKVAENRAKVVLAEAEVPIAMAEAFRTGRMQGLDDK
ncbi:MAG: flotillin-like protein FloA [Pirellulales bacterium]|nr:flotillin-like protein FloA [Pirellulales bacterium]